MHSLQHQCFLVIDRHYRRMKMLRMEVAHKDSPRKKAGKSTDMEKQLSSELRMDVAHKDSPRKKAGKSTDMEKQLSSEVRVVITAELPKNGHTPTPKEAVETPPVVENKPKNASTAVNGKETSKPEREKNGNHSQSPVPKDKIPVQNGVTDVALNAVPAAAGETNSVPTETPATEASPEVIEEEGLVIVTEQDNDELFPELNYDETSDTECNFDSSSPNFSPVNRSVTRRSQAKKIPTPETPQLSHSKQDALAVESPVDRPPSRNTPLPDQAMPLREKVLKIKDMYCASPRRESPVPENGSILKKQKESDADKDEGNDSKNGSALASESVSSKTDTNYSKSRIKISPYRRSSRISEQYSTVANYSGNNATQETDIIVDDDVASSSRDQSPVGDSGDDSSLNGSHSSWQKESDRSTSYIDSFKNIKGRRSYRPLREISLIKLSVQRQKATRAALDKETEQQVASISSVNATVGSEPCDTVTSESSSMKWTPVGHVVGRKRRQEDEQSEQIDHLITPSSPALMSDSAPASVSLDQGQGPSKRMRLLGYAASPFRHLRDKMVSSTPIGSRYTQHFATRMSSKSELTKPSDGAAVNISVAEEAMPMASEVLAGRPIEEHKWCAIM